MLQSRRIDVEAATTAHMEVDPLVSNFEQITRELGELPGAPPGLSQMALTLAAGLDSPAPSLIMKASAARELRDTMDRIRELAPPIQAKDFVDEIRDEVGDRRARRSATSP